MLFIFIAQNGTLFDVAPRHFGLYRALIAALFRVIHSFGIKSDVIGNEKNITPYSFLYRACAAE